MQDKLYDVQYDTGDKVIQCGRHNDVFKLWLQWRAKVCDFESIRFPRNAKRFRFLSARLHRTLVQGTEGFEKHMDHLMELSEYMVEKIKSSPDKFYLLLEPEMVNVSFWYVPKRLRNVPHSPDRAELLGQVSFFYSERVRNIYMTCNVVTLLGVRRPITTPRGRFSCDFNDDSILIVQSCLFVLKTLLKYSGHHR